MSGWLNAMGRMEGLIGIWASSLLRPGFEASGTDGVPGMCLHLAWMAYRDAFLIHGCFIRCSQNHNILSGACKQAFFLPRFLYGVV